MYVFIIGLPERVPGLAVENLNINGNNVTLTLSWGEPFNNFDPIVNYTVSCSGDVTCPPNFTTTDNTTRSYTITNLTTMTNYIFSVVATNSIGSGVADELLITTPGENTLQYTLSIDRESFGELRHINFGELQKIPFFVDTLCISSHVIY